MYTYIHRVRRAKRQTNITINKCTKQRVKKQAYMAQLIRLGIGYLLSIYNNNVRMDLCTDPASLHLLLLLSFLGELLVQVRVVNLSTHNMTGVTSLTVRGDYVLQLTDLGSLPLSAHRPLDRRRLLRRRSECVCRQSSGGEGRREQE